MNVFLDTVKLQGRFKCHLKFPLRANIRDVGHWELPLEEALCCRYPGFWYDTKGPKLPRALHHASWSFILHEGPRWASALFSISHPSRHRHNHTTIVLEGPCYSLLPDLLLDILISGYSRPNHVGSALDLDSYLCTDINASLLGIPHRSLSSRPSGRPESPTASSTWAPTTLVFSRPWSRASARRLTSSPPS